MASYSNGAFVDVRANKNLAWRAGTVTDDVAAGPNGGCWEITLDAPITANDWQGVTRKYGGTENIVGNKVAIFKHADIPGLTEGELIRTQGG